MIRPATLSAARASIVVVVAAIVLAIVIVIASRADRALASHVSCGDTITTDTKLDSNLVNCPDNGIVIGADGVTLDLNGHVIDGDGTLRTDCPKQVICDVGVVNDGHDRLTVKHGAVRQFGLGLLVGTARRNRILGLSGSRNLFSGIVLALAFRTVVRNSAFVRNGLHTDQSGIVLFDSHRNRILGNSFRRNGDIGMFVDRSTHNLIKGNLIVRNPEAGINFQHGAANQVRRNRIVRNGDGVLVDDGAGYVIARNRVSAPGCRPGCGFGIWVARGHDSLVARNLVTHADRTGIRVGGASHIVRRNRVRRTGGDAFIVDPGPGRIKLRRNLARGAGDDGFDIASPMAKLISNRAIGNADLGIEAVRGVSDGGGNIARRNGNPTRCTHIACG